MGKKHASQYANFGSLRALAHLARARHWQCRGGEFESRMLHMKPLTIK